MGMLQRARLRRPPSKVSVAESQNFLVETEKTFFFGIGVQEVVLSGKVSTVEPILWGSSFRLLQVPCAAAEGTGWGKGSTLSRLLRKRVFCLVEIRRIVIILTDIELLFERIILRYNKNLVIG
jgi:hypothetical protein